jgi:hypothetical protein
VLLVGVIDFVPILETAPIPGVIVTDSAPDMSHCKLDDCPTVMVDGFAVKLFITRVAGCVTVIVAVPVIVDVALAAVRV